MNRPVTVCEGVMLMMCAHGWIGVTVKKRERKEKCTFLNNESYVQITWSKSVI